MEKSNETLEITAEHSIKKSNTTEKIDKPKYNSNQIVDNKNSNKSVAKKSPVNLPPNTIYNAVKYISKGKFSRKDVRKMANIVRDKYQNRYGKDKEPIKIEQEENGIKYQVFCYPEKMRKDIIKVVRWYFDIKNITSEKHNDNTARELLKKLRTNNDPRYEMELVKYNLAKIDKEKEKKKAELLARQKLNAKKKQYGTNIKDKKFVKTETNNKVLRPRTTKINNTTNNTANNEIEQLKKDLNIDNRGSSISIIDKAVEKLLNND